MIHGHDHVQSINNKQTVPGLPVGETSGPRFAVEKTASLIG